MTQVFPYGKHTSDIGEAKNYYPFAFLIRIANIYHNKMSCRVVNGVSVSGSFDAKMEVEAGGVKGWIGKSILKIIRFLEEQQRKIS